MQPILVVKIGGGAGIDMHEVYADIAQIARTYAVIVIHGVSERMAQLSTERNMPITMISSPDGHQSRYTSPVIRDLFVEAASQLNQEIVVALNAQHLSAVGLLAPVILSGTRKQAIRAIVDGRVRIIRDDYSGRISHVDTNTLYHLLNLNMIPVVPPLVNSRDGLLNVDGDRAAAQVASALNAETLIILSNVNGVYREFTDPNSLVSHVPYPQIDQAMTWAKGRMKRKVLGAQEALEGGVERVVITNGSQSMPISQAMQGHGTVFTA